MLFPDAQTVCGLTSTWPAKPSALRSQCVSKFSRPNAASVRLPLPNTSRLPNNMQGGKVSFFLLNRLTRCAYHIKLDVLLLVRGKPWIGKSCVGGPLSFSDAFPNLGKRILDFKCLSVRPSVRLHGRPRGPVLDFLKILYLNGARKCAEKIQISIKSDDSSGTVQ